MSTLRNLFWGTLLGAGLALGGYAVYYQTRSAVEAREEEHIPEVNVSQYSLPELMNIIREPQHGDHLMSTGKEAIARMEEKKLAALFFSAQGELYTLPSDLEEEDFNDLSSGSIIAHRDSGLVKLFKKYLGKTTTPLVENNVDWVVFSPNVKIGTANMGGFSTGEKVVYLDTLNVTEKLSLCRLSLPLTHEAQHEATPEGTLRLLNELNAYRKETELTAWLLKRTTSKDKKYKLTFNEEDKLYFEYSLRQNQQQVERGEYLTQFGNDFVWVYPPRILLAGDFLRAGVPISKETLEKYEHFENNNPLDAEFSLAVQTALIAHRFTLHDAKLRYEKMLQGNELEQKNAQSALAYLFPKENASENREEVREYPHLPEQKIKNYIPIQRREAQQRKELQLLEAKILPNNSERMEREINEKFSKLRGDPDKEKGEWMYKGWQTDERGRTTIIYQSEKPFFLQNGEPQHLTKQEIYDPDISGQGKFREAFWNFLPAYEDKSGIPQVWNGTAWVEMENFVIYPFQPEEESQWVGTEPVELEIILKDTNK